MKPAGRGFLLLMGLVLGLVACRDKPKAPPPPVAAPVHPGAVQTDSAAVPVTEPEKPAVAEPDPRQELLRAELDHYDEVILRHDATTLAEKDKAMLRALRQASKVIEELYSLQLHPRSLEWRDQARVSGNELDQRLIARGRVPWCLDNANPSCAAIAAPPPREFGSGLWPTPPFEDTQFAELSRQINGLELLSPFTVVRRAPGRGFEAISYARSELLGPKLTKLAGILDQAATFASDKSLAQFLRRRAASLRADDAFPYDESDLDWLSVTGDYEVTIGPYETYDDPRGLKAMFALVVGRRAPNLTGEISRLSTALPKAEEALAVLLGEPLREPGTAAPPTPVVWAVDAWLVSGEARRAHGALAAYHLPNRGRAAAQGRSKKVVLINHLKALNPGLVHTARSVLGEAAAQRISAEAAAVNALLHELAHGLGPSPASQVTTRDGKSIGLAQALGHDALALEELKAMTSALWLTEFALEQGWSTPEQTDSRKAAAMAGFFETLTYPQTDPHARAAAALLSFLEKEKALVAADDLEQLRLEPSTWKGALDSLCQQLFGGLLHAESKALRALLVEAPRLRASAAKAQRGHRPVTLDYAIDGL